MPFEDLDYDPNHPKDDTLPLHCDFVHSLSIGGQGLVSRPYLNLLGDSEDLRAHRRLLDHSKYLVLVLQIGDANATEL